MRTLLGHPDEVSGRKHILVSELGCIELLWSDTAGMEVEDIVDQCVPLASAVVLLSVEDRSTDQRIEDTCRPALSSN